MIRQAQARFPIDLSRSFVIGDKLADVGLAEEVGARGVLVRTGYGDDIARTHGGHVPGAARVSATLMDAVDWIRTETGHPREGA